MCERDADPLIVRWILNVDGIFTDSLCARAQRWQACLEGDCHGPVVSGPDRAAVAAHLGRHRAVRTAAAPMSALYWIALLLTLGLLGYLLYAMLNAEKF